MYPNGTLTMALSVLEAPHGTGIETCKRARLTFDTKREGADVPSKEGTKKQATCTQPRTSLWGGGGLKQSFYYGAGTT